MIVNVTATVTATASVTVTKQHSHILHMRVCAINGIYGPASCERKLIKHLIKSQWKQTTHNANQEATTTKTTPGFIINNTFKRPELTSTTTTTNSHTTPPLERQRYDTIHLNLNSGVKLHNEPDKYKSHWNEPLESV